MAKWVRRLAFAASFTLVAASCGGNATSGSSGDGTATASPPVDEVTFPMTITDAVGDQITLEGPAEVGCLWYGCMEDMADMGLTPKAAGVSKAETSSAFLFPMGPPEHVITNAENVEDWAKADVDVIVNADELPQWEALKSAAPIFHYYFPLIQDPTVEYQGVEALKQNIRLLGQMLGEPERAEDAVTRYDRFIEAIAAAAPPEAADNTVAFLQATDDGTYTTVSADQLVILCDAVVAAGLGSCIEATESGQINAEDFLAQDPDWIVYSFGDHTERDDPVWGLLSAVKNDQVYDSDNWLVGESLRIIEHALQEYAYHSLPESGIPDPGPMEDFDSASSPLAQGAASATPSG